MFDKKKAYPILAISVIAIAALFLMSVPTASADDSFQIIGTKNYTTGQNYDQVEDLLTGSGTLTIYPHTRILDFVDENGRNHWTDYIVNEDANTIQVETAQGSIVFDKSACSATFYNGDRITAQSVPKIYGDSYTAKRSTDGSGVWQGVAQINNAACVPTISVNNGVIEIVGNKSKAGVGDFLIKYIKKTGADWKVQLEPTNWSALTDQRFGVTQTLEIPRIVQVGDDITKDLANFNNTVLDRAWLESHKAMLINFKNGISFDFGLGWENVDSIRIYYFGGDTAFLAINYFRNAPILLPNETLIIDPTFTVGDSSEGRVFGNGVAAATCSATFNAGDANSRVLLRSSVDAGVASCEGAYARYDVSALPSNIEISQFNFTISATSTNLLACDLRYLDLNAGANQTTYDNIVRNTGLLYTNITTGNAFCATTGSKTIQFGASAISLMESEINSGDNTLTFGIRGTPPRDGTTRLTNDNYMESSSISIAYIIAPCGENLVAATQSTSRINLDWDLVSGCSTPTNWRIFYETPTGAGFTTLTNNTGNATTAWQVTGLTPATQYNFMVQYVNASGVSANSTAAANYTMPNTPSLSLAPVNATAINATSTAGAVGGNPVTDFGLRCEINRTGGWQTEVVNSTIPANRMYTIGSLWTDGDLIICQWRDGFVGGWSDWSANATYPARPDAVTDLTVVGIFQTTAEIEWTEPNLHGLNLTGYQVNFTSPWGNPLTEITTTNTSDTEYAVTGLAANTQYSMRVSAVTIAGNNATGNIINFATATNFTVGQIDIDAENPLRMPIRFVRDDINATTTALTVTYDNGYDLTCDMFFKFSQTNQTFPNINGTAASSSEDEHTFYFLNPETEIISVDCYDTITNDTGSYLMMQSNFPLLDLIAGFRDGTYGTQGMFGAIDLITLMAIILGMIGFNRTNPAVGLIFMFFIIGGLSVFGIVQWYTAVTGLVATLLLFAVSSTRKDD